VWFQSKRPVNEEWIDIMKTTKRLKLSRWQALEHYFVVIFMLIVPFLMLIFLFEIYISKTYTGVRTANDFISFALPMVVIAIVFYFIQNRRLRFREFQIKYTNQEFQQAVRRTVREYEWEIEINNEHIFRANRPSNWTGSWGEMVTIIKGKDRLLINSICDPDKWSSVLSYGWNRRNVNTFLKNLSDVKNGVPVQKRIEKPEKEWSLKRIVIRIFAYPFCFFIIGLGFFMIISPVNLMSPFAGLGAIAVAIMYLYTDLKMILKSKSANNSQTSDGE